MSIRLFLRSESHRHDGAAGGREFGNVSSSSIEVDYTKTTGNFNMGPLYINGLFKGQFSMTSGIRWHKGRKVRSHGADQTC